MNAIELINLLPLWIKIVVIFAVLAICTGIAIAVVVFSKSFSFGKFKWLSRFNEPEDKKYKDLEVTLAKLQARVTSLEMQHVKDELTIRIEAEFRNLRNYSRERRKRFTANIVYMYSNIFEAAIDSLCNDHDHGILKLHKSLYSEIIDNTIRNTVGSQMTKLIFDNEFLETPTETDPAHDYTEKEREFRSDTSERCSYLLRISSKEIREKWEAPFPRKKFEKEFMPEIEAQALTEGTNYFYDVISKRDKDIRAMHEEYGDKFMSFHSFKTFVETEYNKMY